MALPATKEGGRPLLLHHGRALTSRQLPPRRGEPEWPSAARAAAAAAKQAGCGSGLSRWSGTLGSAPRAHLQDSGERGPLGPAGQWWSRKATSNSLGCIFAPCKCSVEVAAQVALRKRSVQVALNFTRTVPSCSRSCRTALRVLRLQFKCCDFCLEKLPRTPQLPKTRAQATNSHGATARAGCSGMEKKKRKKKPTVVFHRRRSPPRVARAPPIS